MQCRSIQWLVAVAAIVLAAWTGSAGQTQTQQVPPGSTASAVKEPSTQDVNDALVQQISKQIAGHVQEPAGHVFKNIQLDVLKKTPDARLLLIMNLGYSRALGVTCKQ